MNTYDTKNLIKPYLFEIEFTILVGESYIGKGQKRHTVMYRELK